jgi:hypothetical protein
MFVPTEALDGRFNKMTKGTRISFDEKLIAAVWILW